VAQQRTIWNGESKTHADPGETPLDLGAELQIDVICTNQSSGYEKVHQVSMMGTIFAKAIRTIIWLAALAPNYKSWTACTTLKTKGTGGLKSEQLNTGH
jgi:hypothetical protein